jgi:predicted Rossmann fold nucleotide-binding protein DprA/Smf involved in DNA uptake
MNPREVTLSEIQALFRGYPYKPSRLFMIGGTSWRWPVAVVGTRKPSPEAVSLTRELVRALVRDGFAPIITGGAPGIDTIATQEALGLGQKPVVVWPCLNKKARKWAGSGAVVVSEGLECTSEGLVLRDRVVAGLARAIIVPEARVGTARKACCGTWYTAVKFGVQVGRPAFVFKPLVVDVDVHEAFEEFVRSGAVPVGSIDELLARLRGLFGGWFP